MEDKTQYDKVHTHEGFKLTKPVGGFTLSYVYIWTFFLKSLRFSYLLSMNLVPNKMLISGKNLFKENSNLHCRKIS